MHEQKNDAMALKITNSTPMKEKVKRILILALPMILGALGRVILNLVDTAMIGALGAPAVAAVGLGVFTTSLVGDFLVAISGAVLALTARRIGEGQKKETGYIFTEAIIICLSIGIPISIVGAAISPFIMPLINNNPEVITEGTWYLMIRNAGWVFLMLFYAFQGFYNGTGRPALYLKTIGVMVIANIILNSFLIHGLWIFPKLGVAGAALATVSATVLGVILFFIGIRKDIREYNVLKRYESKTKRKLLRKKIFPLFISIGIQQAAVLLGFFIFNVVAGFVSVSALAGTTILIQLANTFVLIASALGRTAGTLIGSSLGANEKELSFRIGIDTAFIGLFLLLPINALCLIAPELILRIFTEDQSVITISILLLQILGAGLILDTFGTILMQGMLSAGYIKTIVTWNLIGMWAIFIPFVIIGALVLNLGMIGLWVPLYIYRILLALVFIFLYIKKKWASVKL